MKHDRLSYFFFDLGNIFENQIGKGFGNQEIYSQEILLYIPWSDNMESVDLWCNKASLLAQLVKKNLPVVQEIWFLGWEDMLLKDNAPLLKLYMILH